MEWQAVLDQIEAQDQWKQPLNRDIPLFLQNKSDIEIKRVVQDHKITSLKTPQDWKMNLMVVSEKHGLVIIAVDHELHVYRLDPVSMTIIDPKSFKKVTLENDNQEINNLKLIACNNQEFIVTVDMAGQLRMFYLKDLDRDPFKYNNINPATNDNSTWSVDGSRMNPPRVAVGSNTHQVTVYDLASGLKQTINAHQHNVPCVSFSPCGKFLASTSIDRRLKVWEETKTHHGQTTFKCARFTVPSNDWGWAVQWIDKTHCNIELVKQDDGQQRPIASVAQSLSRQTDDSLRSLLTTARSGDHRVTGGDIFQLIQNLQNSRQNLMQQLRTGQYAEEGGDTHGGSANGRAEDSLGDSSDHDDDLDQQQPIPQEQSQDSVIVNDSPVEQGTEKTTEQHLDKYIILHCAKLELSLIDVSSGQYLGNLSETQIQAIQNREACMMKTFIRQNVQNSMYFEELDLSEVFNMRNYSRYLFLEFLEDFSLILVGNQGSYDLHLFRLTNKIDPSDGSSKYKLTREYVYKGHSISVRILGVSVVRSSPECNRIYILTADKRLNVLEVRRHKSCLQQINELLI